ncbi:GTPase-activating protein [Glaciecola sp. XM2]|jgi:ribosome assembly protein YihI (activator of Der GTPase)|uniref:Der GTPase-activating protein YihI n=1 Tax=Glaciecola sp. XM2 TaxID=1914931 RepID=UPI001BDE5AD3|nr:Der GTPase-activating protein YihI [Glaciecola sp. XM2]MBT1451598.1 GTPase-activating protein [Glaciecola sp. XM2]
MPRQKKSRKIGKIGIAKVDAPKRPQRAPSTKSKVTSGNKAGTRQQVAEVSAHNKTNKPSSDPRIGSKKAIDLNKYQQADKPKQVKQKSLSPQQELDALEQDPMLDVLLTKQEKKTLTKTEKQQLDKMLSRHKTLCKSLGIQWDESDSQTETDPFDALDAIRLDDYQD